MRIYLANVGANMYLWNKRRLASPLFEDSRFEFLPIIPGDPRIGDPDLDKSLKATHYRDLRSQYDRAQDLAAYIPPKLLDKAVHNSPEFETFTYCDDCRFSRAAKLKDVGAGDVLLFAAGLRRWDGGRWTNEYGLHLIGGFHIEKTPIQAQGAPPDEQMSERFAKNAYVIKGRETGRWDRVVGDWLFAGSGKSRRFDKAVPLNREICDQVFRDINGAPWGWGPTQSGRTRSKSLVIGTYTRTVRCFLDTSRPEEEERAATLRDWIAKRTGERDATLLDG